MKRPLTTCRQVVDEVMSDGVGRTVRELCVLTGWARANVDRVLRHQLGRGCSAVDKKPGHSKYVKQEIVYQYDAQAIRRQALDPDETLICADDVLAAARLRAVPSVWALGARV